MSSQSTFWRGSVGGSWSEWGGPGSDMYSRVADSDLAAFGIELVPGVGLHMDVVPGPSPTCPCAIAAETAATGGRASSSTSIDSSSASSPSESAGRIHAAVGGVCPASRSVPCHHQPRGSILRQIRRRPRRKHPELPQFVPLRIPIINEPDLPLVKPNLLGSTFQHLLQLDLVDDGILDKVASHHSHQEEHEGIPKHKVRNLQEELDVPTVFDHDL